jgi:hypothetical protein
MGLYMYVAIFEFESDILNWTMAAEIEPVLPCKVLGSSDVRSPPRSVVDAACGGDVNRKPEVLKLDGKTCKVAC